MKIQLLAKELLPSIQTVINVVERKNNLPILSHVLIILKNKQLTLITTDLEIQIQITTDIQCQKEYSFTLYAKSLIDIIKDLNEETIIYFDITDNKIKIKINKNYFELNSFNNQDFPLLDSQSDYKTITANAKELKNLIDKTSFTIANQDIRIYLNGLYIEVNNNQLVLVSTDGYRLSIGHINQKNTGVDKHTAIIPKKSITEITKLLTKAQTGDEINIDLSKNYLKIEFKNIIIISQLISGRYPNYQQVLPNESKGDVIINRQEFLNALRTVIPLIDENNKGIHLTLKDENILIQTKSERGKAQASINIKTKIKILEVNFNIYFLISSLDKLTSNHIIMTVPDGSSESYLFVNQDDSNYQYIIMPIRV